MPPSKVGAHDLLGAHRGIASDALMKKYFDLARRWYPAEADDGSEESKRAKQMFYALYEAFRVVQRNSNAKSSIILRQPTEKELEEALTTYREVSAAEDPYPSPEGGKSTEKIISNGRVHVDKGSNWLSGEPSRSRDEGALARARSSRKSAAEVDGGLERTCTKRDGIQMGSPREQRPLKLALSNSRSKEKEDRVQSAEALDEAPRSQPFSHSPEGRDTLASKMLGMRKKMGSYAMEQQQQADGNGSVTLVSLKTTVTTKFKNDGSKVTVCKQIKVFSDGSKEENTEERTVRDFQAALPASTGRDGGD